MGNYYVPAKRQAARSLLEELRQFLRYQPPEHLRRRLQQKLLDYARKEVEKDMTVLPEDDLLWDVYHLLELLDLAETFAKRWQEND